MNLISLGGGCPFQAGLSGFTSFPQPVEEHKVRGKPELFADHYSQATLFWNSPTPIEKSHIVKAFRFELTKAQVPAIRERVISMLVNVDKVLAQAIADGLGILMLAAMPKAIDNLPTQEVTSSPPRHYERD